VPTLSFDLLLEIARSVPEAGIKDWGQIKRIDVRPGKGVAKIQTEDHWEIQIDHHSGKIMQVAYRRSDIIEALDAGSFFHNQAKLWIFLPAAVMLLTLWITGIYLFLLPILNKNRNKNKTRKTCIKVATDMS